MNISALSLPMSAVVHFLRYILLTALLEDIVLTYVTQISIPHFTNVPYSPLWQYCVRQLEHVHTALTVPYSPL